MGGSDEPVWRRCGEETNPLPGPAILDAGERVVLEQIWRKFDCMQVRTRGVFWGGQSLGSRNKHFHTQAFAPVWEGHPAENVFLFATFLPCFQARSDVQKLNWYFGPFLGLPVYLLPYKHVCDTCGIVSICILSPTQLSHVTQ